MPSRNPVIQKDVIDDPLDYLWQGKREEQKKQIVIQNKNNYELLVRSFDRSEFVSFLGAGVSKPLGISDWSNLIDDLWKEANKLGFKESIPDDKDQYPDFAERIFKFFEQKKKESLYFDAITKRMAPSINSTSLTLVYLTFSVDIHLTTNFDRSIEHAYHFREELATFLSVTNKYTKPLLYFLKDFDTSLNGPSIYYLHGSVNEGIYVLKKSDYDMFYPSVSKSVGTSVRGLEECLKYFYGHKNIIFIGCSFEDPYVRSFFFDLAKEVERERLATSSFYGQGGQSCSFRDLRHFLLIEEGNKFIEGYGEELFPKLKEYCIHPVIYQKDKHIFLEYLFKRLIKNKPEGAL
jgi:hypothetical protein